MTTSLITVDGMIHHHAALTVEDLIDHAVVDVEGRLLVAMFDVLAMAKLDADAEVIRVRYVDGASYVMRVAEIVDHDDLYLQLHVPQRPNAADACWRVRLWSPDSGPSPQVASIHAMSFATFVGQP